MRVRAFSGILCTLFMLAPVLTAQEAFARSHLQTSSYFVQHLRNSSGIKERVVKRHGEHKGCSIALRYPQFRGVSKASIRKLNYEIKHLIDRNISMTPAPSGQQKYVYECDYKTKLLTNDLISLSFEFTSDLGGATPGSVVVPLNVQFSPAFKILKLTDVLNKNVDYKLLSALLEKDLRSKSLVTTNSLDAFPNSTFDNFALDQSAIQFTVSQGVLADALQCPTGSITFLQLKKEINKTSPIRRFILKQR